MLQGSKWTLTSLWKYLQKNSGIEKKPIWDKGHTWLSISFILLGAHEFWDSLFYFFTFSSKTSTEQHLSFKYGPTALLFKVSQSIKLGARGQSITTMRTMRMMRMFEYSAYFFIWKDTVKPNCCSFSERYCAEEHFVGQGRLAKRIWGGEM